MASTPVQPNSLPTSDSSLVQVDANRKQEESNIEQVAKQNLNPQTQPAPQSMYSRFWALFSWKKAAPEDQNPPAVESQQEESEVEAEINQDGELDVEEENPEDQVEKEDEDLGSPSDAKKEALGLVVVKDNGKSLEKEEKVESSQEVVKTAEVGQSWWKSKVGNLIQTGVDYTKGGLAVGLEYVKLGGAKGWEGLKSGGAVGWDCIKILTSMGIQSQANSYNDFLKKTKEQTIAASKEDMLKSGVDTQFVELFDFVRLLTSRSVNGKMTSLVKEENKGFIATNLSFQQELILNIVEVNLAKGFVNLAKQLKQNKDNIPGYDNQSTLVNILSLFSQKVSACVNRQFLADIEEKYRDDRAQLPILSKQVIPDIESNPEKQALIQRFIQEGDLSHQLTFKLFPEYENASLDRRKEINQLLSLLMRLNKRHIALQKVFETVADEILVCLFPEKLKDMEIPSLFKFPGIVQLLGMVYNSFVRSAVVDLLQQSYDSVENDPTKIQNWKNDLQTRVGAPDLKPVIQAPSALLVAFTKNYIQADPKVVGMLSGVLNTLMNPQDESVDLDKLSEDQKKAYFLRQMSQEQLANWIVKSVQSMLHTEDPNLLSLGQFIQQVLNNLNLALLAQGAKLVIPEGQQVQGDQFVKELSDRVVEKFQSLRGEDVIPDQFWKEFVQTLPLPPFIKDLLIPKVIEKANDLQDTLKKTNPDWLEIQKISVEAEDKLRNYDYGEELLTITDKISNQIVEQVLEQNIGIITTLGLGDTIEELFAQYLPGVKINEDLKNWFKNNISALGVMEGRTSESMVLLRQAIQAVLNKALVEMIETNFQKNSKDYAAQLLKNIHQAFSKAISGFDQDQRESFDVALTIQEDIKIKTERIQTLKKKTASWPTDIQPQQLTLLEDVWQANLRYLRASTYLDSLKKQRDEFLDKINKNIPGEPLTVNDIPSMSNALIRHKMLSAMYPDHTTYIQELEKQIQELQEKDEEASPEIEQELLEKEILYTLLDMSAEELQWFSQIINIEATIQNGNKELQHLKTDLQKKEIAVAYHDAQLLGNSPEWTKAKSWLDEARKSRAEIEELSESLKELEKELDSHLKTFQILSQELMALIGLGQKEKLNLPAFLQDKIWPIIESAKNEHIARVLFHQISPILLPALDLEKNKEKLNRLSKGNQFLPLFAKGAAEEIVSRIPDFVTSYKPFAELILKTMGIKQPTPQEVASMEAALQEKMIELGKAGVTASMLQSLLKDIVPADKEQLISQELETLVASGQSISKDNILSILEKEFPPSNAKETDKLKKQAQTLAKSVNLFLLNRGKGKLKSQDLLDAYQSQVSGLQKSILPSQKANILQAIQSDKVVEKIKTVIITPEEIASAINDLIPGATELHTLVAPQLQDVIVGQDQTFVDNREFMQRYAEGMLIRLFLKIAESNLTDDQDIMAVLTKKVEKWAKNAALIPGKSAEEVAQEMINEVIEDIIGLQSSADLVGISPVLRQVGYEKIKEQAYQHLTPLILPMIEREQNRAELDRLSGSKFMSSLCTALSKDIFSLLPHGVDSYLSIASRLFVILSDGTPPTDTQLEQFAKEIEKLQQNSKEKDISNHAIIKSYAKVIGANLSSDQINELKIKLKKVRAKEQVRNVLITPEKLANLMSQGLPYAANPQIQKAFATELQSLMHDQSDIYQNMSGFVGTYVEGMLLRIFIGIAQKNKGAQDKDTLLVLVDHLLKLVKDKYPDINKRPFDEVARELNDSIMKDILGIDSPDALEGLPVPLKATAYNLIKDQLGKMLIYMQQHVATLEDNTDEVAPVNAAIDMRVKILSEDLANLVMSAVPDVLTDIGGDKLKGVNLISKGVENYLEELARKDLAVAKLLLNYTKGDQFQQLLGENLEKIADAENLPEDKKKAAQLLSNLILAPLTRTLQKAVDFENNNDAATTQNLMAGILKVAAEYMGNLNDAKRLAAQSGRSQMLHQDYVQAAGDQLHPAVPTTAIDYQHSIDEIGKRLFGLLTPVQQARAGGKKFGKLSPEQERAWISAQGKLKVKFAKWIKEEKQGKQVISHLEVITEIEKIHLTIVGKTLTKAQKQALRAPKNGELPLREVIRQEAASHQIQKQKEFYTPATKSLMKMLFPNGKNDLTYIPVELRGEAWRTLKKNLFPVIFPMLTELILDPSAINQMVLSSLETMRNSLLPLHEMPDENLLDMYKKDQLIFKTTGTSLRDNLGTSTVTAQELRNLAKAGKIVAKKAPAEPADRELDALDDASGELIAETLKMVKLPNWIKKQIMNPDGSVSPEMKKTLGAVLRNQFNESFIKDKLELALEQLVKRDKDGNYLLNVPPAARTEEEIKNRQNMKAAKDAQVKAGIKQVSREVIDVSIAYFIRTKWEEAQARFDKVFEKKFGRAGVDLKRGLDMVFGFIFFKIVGTILSVLFSPIKGWVKEKIYHIVSLDENRDMLLDLLTQIPADQPMSYAPHLEDALFRIGRHLKTTLEGSLEEPLIPQPLIVVEE